MIDWDFIEECPVCNTDFGENTKKDREEWVCCPYCGYVGDLKNA